MTDYVPTYAPIHIDDLHSSGIFKGNKEWYISPSYDGDYCQIHWDGKEATLYTRNGKPFLNDYIVKDLKTLCGSQPMIFEGCYLILSTGKLAPQIEQPTYNPVLAYKKGFPYERFCNIAIFDVLVEGTFTHRLPILEKFQEQQANLKSLLITTHKPVTNVEQASAELAKYIEQGYRGCVLKIANYRHGQLPQSRLVSVRRKTLIELAVTRLHYNFHTQRQAKFVTKLVCRDADNKLYKITKGMPNALKFKLEEHQLGRVFIGYYFKHPKIVYFSHYKED